MDDLINGDGTAAEYSALAGANYVANQSAYDVADNGQVTNNSAQPASWLTSLQKFAGLATQGLAAVQGIVGTNPSSSSSPEKPGTGSSSSAATIGTAKSFSPMLIIGAVVVAVVAFFVLRRR
jgi:hypothetical protein